MVVDGGRRELLRVWLLSFFLPITFLVWIFDVRASVASKDCQQRLHTYCWVLLGKNYEALYIVGDNTMRDYSWCTSSPLKINLGRSVYDTVQKTVYIDRQQLLIKII